MRGDITKTLLIALLCLPVGALAANSDQTWHRWRGPTQQGYAEAQNLPETWSEEGQNLIWKVPYGSRSTPLVMNGHVYLINRAGTDQELIQERVMALDINTGKVIWEHRFNVFLTDIVSHRLGWAELAGDPETGNIYAHGVQGLFYCFNKDGKILWSKSLTESFGRISGYGGRTNSPVIDGDQVIISSLISGWGPHGRPVHRFMAMDKHTGEIQWWASPSGRPLDTTYSVPVIETYKGVRTLFSGVADGAVYALQANTGKTIWKFQLSKRGINSSVLFQDGKVYASHSEENLDTNVMGRVVCINADGKGDITKTHEVWRIDALGAGYASPAFLDGRLYVADNSANLHCLDAASGESHWMFNYGTACRGSALIADNKAYIGEVNGKYHIIQLGDKEAKRLHEIEFFEENGSPIEIFSSPSTVQGRVFLSTKEHTYCIGNDSKPVKAVAPKMAKIKKSKPGKAVHLQIVPAETWIASGASQKYKAKAYDANGEFVKEMDVTWGMKGVKGSFKGNQFNGATTKRLLAGVITAKAGDLEASARLRIIPDLPYSEDFESWPVEKPPPGWITSPTKSQVVELDGNKVLKKLANRPHPAFARMRNYIMPPIDAGYTIQADIMGKAKKRRFIPDVGLINSRYMAILMGTTRKPVIRLVTWAPMPRLQKDFPFDWKADQWYTMKFSYDVVDGKGMVRAKVWPKGEAEPEAWTAEMVDPIPNTGGSPGLYGYSVAITDKSPGTETFYDNVMVTENK